MYIHTTIRTLYIHIRTYSYLTPQSSPASTNCRHTPLSRPPLVFSLLLRPPSRASSPCRTQHAELRRRLVLDGRRCVGQCIVGGFKVAGAVWMTTCRVSVSVLCIRTLSSSNPSPVRRWACPLPWPNSLTCLAQSCIRHLTSTTVLHSVSDIVACRLYNSPAPPFQSLSPLPSARLGHQASTSHVVSSRLSVLQPLPSP